MTLAVDRADAARFRDLVAARLGLRFDDEKLDELADVLRARALALRAPSAAAYLRSVNDDETAVLAERLTVGETYFFRYREQFDAFAEVALPAALASAHGAPAVLSAGCASGEEAHSLAMIVRERAGERSPVAIHAFDVNPSAVARAKEGRYSSWALRETPAALRERWFRADGSSFELDASIRAMVRFERRNLLADDPRFWAPDSFDVVFCRNVIMYFDVPTMRAVIDRIARAMRPGAYLFLGHAETLRGISSDFHLRHTHETFYYQRKDAHERVEPATTLGTPAPIASALGLDDGSWIDVIRRASERVATLTTRAAPSPARAPPAPSDRGPVIDMLRQERFGDALELLATFDAEDPETELLEAALLTHAGRLRDAERACAALLARDEMNAGAHYLMALCREHAGDRVGALEHDRIAAYLDPRFVMPHVHLGILERRAGHYERARAELEAALALLPAEDAARVLLFGGGFGRDALAHLCRSELRRCGGPA